MNYYRIWYNREALGGQCREAVEEVAAETAADALVIFDVNIGRDLKSRPVYFDGPRRMQAAGHEVFTFRVDMRDFHVHASDVGDAIEFFRMQRAGEGELADWEFTAASLAAHQGLPGEARFPPPRRGVGSRVPWIP